MKKFIAYFDILGYGERIKQKNIDEEYVIQKRLLEEIREIIEKNAKKRADFHTVSFSDTHIFYTNDISDLCYEQVKDFEIFKFFVKEQVLFSYSVPFKEDKRENRYVVNIESFPRIWGDKCKHMPVTKPEFIENVFMNKGEGDDGLLSINGDARRKMENTKEFFTYARKKNNTAKGL